MTDSNISAEDADRLLDYRDNELPLYCFEIKRYKRELEILEVTITQGS